MLAAVGEIFIGIQDERCLSLFISPFINTHTVTYESSENVTEARSDHDHVIVQNPSTIILYLALAVAFFTSLTLMVVIILCVILQLHVRYAKINSVQDKPCS